MTRQEPATPADDREPTFEEAMAELEAIAEAVDDGRIGLEDAIAQYERGTRLIRHCRAILARAEAKVHQLRIDENGTLVPEPHANVDPAEPGA